MEIKIKFYKKPASVTLPFSAIERIYVSNWLILEIKGEKKYLIGKYPPDLLDNLNKIKNVEWSKFAKATYDKRYKRP